MKGHTLYFNTLNLNPLSSGVSTAKHWRWSVLPCCFMRAGWSLSAVIFSLSPQSFQLPVCLSPAATSFLSPRRFYFPSFAYFSAVKWLVFHIDIRLISMVKTRYKHRYKTQSYHVSHALYLWYKYSWGRCISGVVLFRKWVVMF